MKKVSVPQKCMAMFMAYLLVFLGCKKADLSQLANDNQQRQSEADYNGFIVAIEKYKNDALSGGYLSNLVDDKNKSKSYKEVMRALIQLATEKQMSHIVTLAKLSMAETLYQLKDRQWGDLLPAAAASLNKCDFPIPCMTMLAEFTSIANMDPDLALSRLSDRAPLASSIQSKLAQEPKIISATVTFKYKVMQTYARYIKAYGYPNNPSQFGADITGIYASETTPVKQAIAALKREYREKFSIYTETAEAYANGIVGEFKDDNGRPLTLGGLDEQTRKNILSESNIYRSELVQLFITLTSLEELTRRNESQDKSRYFRSLRVQNNLEGQGRFNALMMFAKHESSVPSRFAWADAVKRNAAVLGQGFAPFADTASSMVKGVVELMEDFVYADPYFKGMKTFSVVRTLMESETMIARETRQFVSVPYQVIKMKERQQIFNGSIEKLKKLPESQMKDSAEMNNFKSARAAVHGKYMSFLCHWSHAHWRGASPAVRREGRPDRSYIPPYECKAANSMSFKNGTWPYADSECKDHAYKLQESKICGTGTSFRGLESKVNDNITKLEIKKIWDPVITKSIILGAAALSIIVTMGATSYLAVGAAATGATAAGGAAVTAVQISTAARLGYFVLNALIGSAIFTVTNNAILLATGVKKFNNKLLPSMLKEFILGFGMMLFLPVGAMAGEALAGVAAARVTNEFYKALITKGVTVTVDTVTFLFAIPPSIFVMNLMDGTPGRTWKQLSNMHKGEEVLIALLFSLGLRMNFKANYYKKQYTFRQEFGMALGRGPGNGNTAPKSAPPASNAGGVAGKKASDIVNQAGQPANNASNVGRATGKASDKVQNPAPAQ